MLSRFAALLSVSLTLKASLLQVVDVRDTADAQRRMAESPLAANGSRYLGWSPSDGSGELTSFEVVEILHR